MDGIDGAVAVADFEEAELVGDVVQPIVAAPWREISASVIDDEAGDDVVGCDDDDYDGDDGDGAVDASGLEPEGLVEAGGDV